MMIIGIDQSLRSTGICILSSNKKLIDFVIIASRTENEKTKKYQHLPILNDEDLLIYNSNKVVDLVKKQVKNGGRIIGGAFEGLSHGSLSGSRDLIAANLWRMKCELKIAFPDAYIGIVPVSAWRSKVIHKSENKELTEKYGKKLRFKQGCVDKLPIDIKERFEKYIEEKSLKKECLFDLTDAYFLSIYRLGLEE